MKIFLVNDKEYSSLISPFCNLQNGPWVAGGSVRKVWQGLPWRNEDIDFFFNGATQFGAMINRIDEFGVVDKYKHVTDNAITYKIRTDPEGVEIQKNSSIWNLSCLKEVTDEANYSEKCTLKIQMIQKRWFATAMDLLDSFDFGVAQFVTDGNVIIATNQAIHDCENKVIRCNPKHIQEIKPNRLIKYAAYGFDPDPDVFTSALKNLLANGVGDDTY